MIFDPHCFHANVANMRKKLAFLVPALFLLTLVNHWVLPWFVGAFLLVVYASVFKIGLPKKVLFETFFLVLLLAIFALKFVVLDVRFVASASVSAFQNNAIVMVLLVFVWGVLRSISLQEDEQVLISAVRLLLVVHLAVFFVQFFTYLFLGLYLDFVQPFTGEISRYGAFDKGLSGIGGVRPTGFFAEPSNFSAVVFFLVVILKAVDGVRLDLISVVSLIAMVLAFSTAGVILAVCLLAVLVLAGNGQKPAKLVFISLLILAAGVFLDQLLSLYLAQERKYLSSSDIRFSLVDFILARDGLALFFGYGPFGVEPSLYAATTDTAGGRIAASMTDSGTAVFLMLNFGLLGLLIYAAIVWWQHKGLWQTCLFLLATFSKLSIFSPVWIILYLFLLESDRLKLHAFELKVGRISG